MKLLILSCGARKRPVTEPMSAGELYTGPLWTTLRKYQTQDVRVAVLSAEHGLIPADKTILPYDRRLDPARVAELRKLGPTDKAAGVIYRVTRGLRMEDRVAVCGGGDYIDLARTYIEYAYRCGFVPSPTPDAIINGPIGKMRAALREFLTC